MQRDTKPLNVDLGLNASVTVRITPDLKQWLIDKGRSVGVNHGTMARILLMKARQAESERSSG